MKESSGFMEYGLAECTGTNNVADAIETKASEGWYVHSIIPAGLVKVEHPLNPKQAEVHMKYLVLFERPLGVIDA